MNSSDILTLLFVAVCVLPLISLAVLGVVLLVVGRRQYERFVMVDADRLYAEYEQRLNDDPRADTDVILRQMIRRQAVKTGIVGAVTGFGGFVTLPIALPVDLLLSARIQASMIELIARVYGHENDMESRAAAFMILSGSGEITRFSVRVASRYALRIVGKSFSKLVPFLGTLIAFGVNYTITLSTGRTALAWYRAKTNRALEA